MGDEVVIRCERVPRVGGLDLVITQVILAGGVPDKGRVLVPFGVRVRHLERSGLQDCLVFYDILN